MPQQLNKLRHCAYLIHFHWVIVTKYRRTCVTKPMLERLQQIFSDTLAIWECELVEFNGESDHLHILMSVNPKVQPSKLVNNLKTVSSRIIRKEFAEHLNGVYCGKPVFGVALTVCFHLVAHHCLSSSSTLSSKQKLSNCSFQSPAPSPPPSLRLWAEYCDGSW